MGDSDRVRCTTYLFRDDSSLWWEGADHGVNIATLTWDRFKEIFYEKYLTADVRGRLKREFMTLRQGDVYVAEFMNKFDRGCHFVPLIARDVAEKLRYFMDDIEFEVQRKRNRAQKSNQQSKKPFMEASKGQGQQKLGAQKNDVKPLCKECNHHHYGKCLSGKCFKCEERGHISLNCPKLQAPATGRAYVIHAKEAEAEPDTTLITGNQVV
ncbi:uncharacterized protein [Primulina eburnea]|uniref:uncharacterized protein n=1 Tax=Primulina eburnea TaxID=1245227 RepID=UPI003C6C17AA